MSRLSALFRSRMKLRILPLNLEFLEGLLCHRTFADRRELHTMDRRDDAPIACTLQPGDYKRRLAWIAELTREGLVDASREDLRLELKYEPGVADRVRGMVRKEQQCGAFLNFDLSENDEGVSDAARIRTCARALAG